LRVTVSLKRWAVFLLMGGVVLSLIATVLAALGSQRTSPQVCPGQSVTFRQWTLALDAIKPVAEDTYTALETKLTVRLGDSEPQSLRPQLRQAIAGFPASVGTARITRWNGELMVRLLAFSASQGCVTLALNWSNFGNWVGYGAALAGLGLLLLLLPWLALFWRRITALGWFSNRKRNAELHAFSAAPVRYPALVFAMFLVAVASGYLLLGRRDAPLNPPWPGGPALIKARQSLKEGPPTNNHWLIIADAMTRHGQYREAAGMLLGAVEKSPNNAEAWLALGDALYSANDGRSSQAADFAYDCADRADALVIASDGLAARAMERSGRERLAEQWRKRRALLTTVDAKAQRACGLK
jgi:hypothetical protein